MQTYKVTVDWGKNIQWFNDKEERHRLDGPAFEGANGDREWWVNNKLHRLDGPAIEYADGDKEWYVNGELMTEKAFNKYIKPKPSCEGRTTPISGPFGNSDWHANAVAHLNPPALAPTPRTDAATKEHTSSDIFFDYVCPKDMAEIERELAAANKRLADCEFLSQHRYKIIQRQEPRCNEAAVWAEKAEAELANYKTALEIANSSADELVCRWRELRAEVERLTMDNRILTTRAASGDAQFAAVKARAERAEAEVERLEGCCDELHTVIDNAGYPSGKDYAAMTARVEKA
jgi:hypothetical protein